MKTFLVPTDFSDTAKNAARYAMRFAENIKDSRVILFHTYDRHGYGSDGTPLQLNEEDEKNIALAALSVQRAALLENGSAVPVEMMAHAGGLNEELEQVVKELDIDTIIMGVNESSALDQFLTGSSTVKLINKHIAPVLIIPENVTYRDIEQIAFASDLHQVEDTTPVALINELCNIFDTNIQVVHVGSEYDMNEKELLEKKLSGCSPAFDFVHGKGLAAPLNEYAETHNTGLLIMVSREHDFFERLFKRSHTQIMAHAAHIPILAVHESLCSVTVS